MKSVLTHLRPFIVDGFPSYSEVCTWSLLHNTTVDCENLLISNSDVPHFDNAPSFLAKNLFIDDCNKTFAFHWLTHRTFPLVRNIYLNSHPGDQSVFRRQLGDGQAKIHVHQNFDNYREIWANDYSHVRFLSHLQYQEELQKYELEDLDLDKIPIQW